MIRRILIMMIIVSQQIPTCHIPTWWDYVIDDKVGNMPRHMRVFLKGHFENNEMFSPLHNWS